jgi:hypothetical protein
LGAKSSTSATSDTTPINQPENVADDAQHVADVLRMPLPKNASKTGPVADVAGVADLAGDRGEVCAQCRAVGGTFPHKGVWLHPECIRFWSAPTTREGARAQQ